MKLYFKIMVIVISMLCLGITGDARMASRNFQRNQFLCRYKYTSVFVKTKALVLNSLFDDGLLFDLQLVVLYTLKDGTMSKLSRVQLPISQVTCVFQITQPRVVSWTILMPPMEWEIIMEISCGVISWPQRQDFTHSIQLVMTIVRYF